MVFHASHVQVNDKCFLLLYQAETVLLSQGPGTHFITSSRPTCPQDRTDPSGILQATSVETFSQMPQLFEFGLFFPSKKWCVIVYNTRRVAQSSQE